MEAFAAHAKWKKRTWKLAHLRLLGLINVWHAGQNNNQSIVGSHYRSNRRVKSTCKRSGWGWGHKVVSRANCCHKRQIMRLQPNRRQTSNWHKADMLNDVATCNCCLQLATGLVMTALLPTRTPTTRIAHLGVPKFMGNGSRVQPACCMLHIVGFVAELHAAV